MKNIFKILVKRPIALVSLIVLLILYLSMIFAEFLSPYTPETNFKNHGNHPPALILYSPKYGFCPQVQKRILVDEINLKYAKIKGEYYKIDFFVKGPGYDLFGIFHTNIHLFGINVPYNDDNLLWEDGGKNYPVFIFGSDHLGHDLFTRVLYGSRVSLTIGFIGIFISIFLALILGGLAGYYGGFVDWIIMRSAEFFILVPGLYMILFLRSVLSRNLDSAQSFVIITVILSLVGWPGSARLIRGMIHAIKREDFILEAQLEGIPSLVIIFKHIIPQMSSILIVSITLGIPGFILGETVLSYLGLGIVEPAVSWGSLISRDVSTVGNLTNYPWFIIPGIFLLVTTLSFNFLGDLLRDILDPYYRDRSIG
jgi:peptide/nickel transport system permease protein